MTREVVVGWGNVLNPRHVAVCDHCTLWSSICCSNPTQMAAKRQLARTRPQAKPAGGHPPPAPCSHNILFSSEKRAPLPQSKGVGTGHSPGERGRCCAGQSHLEMWLSPVGAWCMLVHGEGGKEGRMEEALKRRGYFDLSGVFFVLSPVGLAFPNMLQACFSP